MTLLKGGKAVASSQALAELNNKLQEVESKRNDMINEVSLSAVSVSRVLTRA